MCLDDIYQPIKSVLLTRDPLPDIKDTFSIVFKEESDKGIHVVDNKSTDKSHISFESKFNNKRIFNKNPGNTGNSANKRIGNNGNKRNYSNLMCKNYGLAGHNVL